MLRLTLAALLLALAPITEAIDKDSDALAWLEHSVGINNFFYLLQGTGDANSTELLYTGIRYELSYQFPESPYYMTGNITYGIGITRDTARNESATVNYKGATHIQLGVKSGVLVGDVLKIYGMLSLANDKINVASVPGRGEPALFESADRHIDISFGLEFTPEGEGMGLDLRILGIALKNKSNTKLFTSSVTISKRF